MSIARHISLGLIVGSSLACATDGIRPLSADLTHAVAMRSCGPADGPAVSIDFTATVGNPAAPQPPFLRVHIWQPVDRLTAQAWTLDGTDPGAAAARHINNTEFESAPRGSVTVSRVEADSTLVGSVDLEFPSGRVRGGFRATWFAGTMLCG